MSCLNFKAFRNFHTFIRYPMRMAAFINTMKLSFFHESFRNPSVIKELHPGDNDAIKFLYAKLGC